MLAKMWKKFLLAVCIIACIYNIMSKLVNRASLEANLRRANDGNTVFDFSSKESKNDNSEIVDGVIVQNTTTGNSAVYNTTNENKITSENETENVSNSSEENPEETEAEEKQNGAVKFTDLIFKW